MGYFTTAAHRGCQMGKGTPLLLFWEKKSPFQKLHEDNADALTLLCPSLRPLLAPESLRTTVEGARSRQVPSSVVQAGGGRLWDLVSDDVLTHSGGRTEKSSCLEPRKGASKK